MPDAQPRWIAGLPMYNWPEVMPAYDALWTKIATLLNDDGLEAPSVLDHSRPHMALARDPHCLVTQTCGYPYVSQLRSSHQLVTTPCYAVSGCDGPYYSSALVVHKDNGAATLAGWVGQVAAVNGTDSQSGYWALRAALAKAGADSPRHLRITGSHRQSLREVATGAADIASVDAVCWAMAMRHEAAAVSELKVIGWSPQTPGLPIVAPTSVPTAIVAALRTAIRAAIRSPDGADVRAATFLADAVDLEDSAYDRIVELSRSVTAVPFPAA